jgi:hypothetical protein
MALFLYDDYEHSLVKWLSRTQLTYDYQENYCAFFSLILSVFHKAVADCIQFMRPDISSSVWSLLTHLTCQTSMLRSEPLSQVIILPYPATGVHKIRK